MIMTVIVQQPSMAHAKDRVHDVLTTIIEKKYPNASGVKIKPISSDGANYSSDIFEATVTTPEGNIEMFAKVGKPTAFTKLMFRKENFVYTILSDAYDKLQDKHGLVEQRFVFLKNYSNAPEDLIIVVENLALKGYVCHDRFKSIGWKYASKSVESLAKYHALSLALRKYFPGEFKTAEEALPVLPVLGSEWDGLVDAALAELDGTDREKLSRLFEGSVGWSKALELFQPSKTPVIVHGDYRSSNLMHKEINGEIHVIPIDYQTAQLGCPAADLIYFILTGSDQQFRQQHFHRLVDHYYEQLALAMKRLDLEPEETYGREEFDNDMKEKLPLGLCTAALSLQFVLVSETDAPNFSDGQFVPPTNELFVERFRGLVDDFKQWGFI